LQSISVLSGQHPGSFTVDDELGSAAIAAGTCSGGRFVACGAVGFNAIAGVTGASGTTAVGATTELVGAIIAVEPVPEILAVAGVAGASLK
jgi:hypothetical protein